MKPDVQKRTRISKRCSLDCEFCFVFPKVHFHRCACVLACDYIGVCVCWADEGEAAAVEEVDSEEAAGWGAEVEVEEAEVTAAAAADDEVSIKLLCVMKRSRSFMAGRKVMMIFSTWEKQQKDEMFSEDEYNYRHWCSDDKKSIKTSLFFIWNASESHW